MNLAQAQFMDELHPYFEIPHFVSNQIGQQPDGNAILYSGVAQAIKASYGEKDHFDITWINEIYKQSQIVPGLINRGPHKKNDHQEHDDYVGLLYFAGRANPYIAKHVYYFGKVNGFIYDNTGISGFGLKQKLSCWHRRFPGQVEHYKLAAGLELNLLERIWWAIGILPIGSSESGIQLQWLKYKTYKESGKSYFITDAAIELWENRMRKRYPNLMGDIFSKYYGENHIFTKWMNGRM